MFWLAFSVQGEVEKYGAYVGIAAFIGLAVLTLLYFSQAREVKRLREWAGRAPERAAEIEAQAVANAEAARREREAAAAQPAAAAASGNGAPARRLRPEEIAAGAFARAAGVSVLAGVAAETGEAPALPQAPPPEPAPEPEPESEAETVAEAAPEPESEAETVAEAAPADASSPAAPNGHRDDVPTIVPAATPAARRGPGPAPTTPSPAPRRPAPAAPAARSRPAAAAPEARGERPVAPTVVLLVAVGVLVLAAVAFAATQLLGGSSRSPNAATPTATATLPGKTATATPRAATLTPASTHVAVLNSTPIPGLAASTRDQLAGAGYRKGNLSASNFSGPQRQQSVVFYRRGARRAAASVARALDISAVQLVDSATQAQAAGKGPAPDVIVVVGGDKSR